MDLELQGKKALITGASQGLGFAAALGLANEGCNICINSRNSERLEAAKQRINSQSKTEVHTVSADITQPESAPEIITRAGKLLEGLDILITNSGGPPSGAFESFDDQAWHTALELNFLSHMRLIRAALPFLRLSSNASVLTVTSMSVKQPIPNLVLSNSVRSATIGLTKTLALELGSEGIRFNSILPGWTQTERVRELMAFRAAENNTTIEDEFEKQAASSPFKRFASPQEFANAAVFLVSPAASYITGSMLVVDGGMYKATY